VIRTSGQIAVLIVDANDERIDRRRRHFYWFRAPEMEYINPTSKPAGNVILRAAQNSAEDEDSMNSG
jgi:hypothetical protein